MSIQSSFRCQLYGKQAEGTDVEFSFWRPEITQASVAGARNSIRCSPQHIADNFHAQTGR